MIKNIPNVGCISGSSYTKTTRTDDFTLEDITVEVVREKIYSYC